MNEKILKAIEESLRNLTGVKLSNKAKAEAIYLAILEATKTTPIFKRENNEHQ